MATTRERKEAKAAQLQEWAQKRTEKAADLYARREPYKGDIAFWTQPGRIPERDRVMNAMERSFEHANKAADMNSRAAGILDQADRSIYSDDTDAKETLEARIADLEAISARRKQINATIRKAGFAAAEALMTAEDKRDLLSVARFQSYYKPEEKGFPPYVASNRNANIRRLRGRLETVGPERTRVQLRPLTVKYDGECAHCRAYLERGAEAMYDRVGRRLFCRSECWEHAAD